MRDPAIAIRGFFLVAVLGLVVLAVYVSFTAPPGPPCLRTRTELVLMPTYWGNGLMTTEPKFFTSCAEYGKEP